MSLHQNAVDVTVGIAFYSKCNPNDLRVAVESVLAQTYPVEHIHLIQDGPIPPILDQLIQQLRARDPRIEHLHIEKNMGLAYCLNRSILDTNSKYYARMDADDYSHPDRLRRQIAYLEQHPSIDILGTWALEYEEEPHEAGALLKSVPLNQHEIRRIFHYKAPMIHASVVFRLTVFAEIGLYNISYRTDEDNDLWVRAIRGGVGMANLPEPLYYIGTKGQAGRRADRRALYEEALNKCKLLTLSPKLNLLKMLSIAYRLLPARVQSMIYRKLR